MTVSTDSAGEAPFISGIDTCLVEVSVTAGAYEGNLINSTVGIDQKAYNA